MIQQFAASFSADYQLVSERNSSRLVYILQLLSSILPVTSQNKEETTTKAANNDNTTTTWIPTT